MRKTLAFLLLLVGCVSAGDDITRTSTVGDTVLPPAVEKRLYMDGFDTDALNELLQTLPTERDRATLLRVLSGQEGDWGLSAPAGSREAALIDRAFRNVTRPKLRETPLK